jgi:hypothetical protein
MIKFTSLNFLLLIVLSLSVTSCDGGATQVAAIDGSGITDTPPPPPPPSVASSVVTFGSITGFGSVIINGVRYDTSNATFAVDGQPAMESDLAIGDVVIVRGTVNDDGITGDADSVIFDDIVQGPLASIDVTTDSFVVLGQAVTVTVETSFDSSIQPTSLDGLSIDDVVEVSGFVDSNGDITATRIERKSPGSEFEVTGIVSSLDGGAGKFNINALIVDFSAAMLENFPAGGINDGDLVEAKADNVSDSGDLVATRVTFRGNDFAVVQDDRAEIEGFVTRFVSVSDFDVSGFPVTTDNQTEFVDGNASDLGLNTKVEIEGVIDANGVAVATRVIMPLFQNFRSLHFEPNNGSNGAGLLTDHASDMPGPPGSSLDYSGRINFPGCSGTPAAEWFIGARVATQGSTRIIRANGPDLIVDIVNGGMFDRCYGPTSVDNGVLEVSLRTVGNSCLAFLNWNFDYQQTAPGTTEYFNLSSADWMTQTPPFDDCGNGGSNQLVGDFNFSRNTIENGTASSELLQTVFLDFFIVYHDQ